MNRGPDQLWLASQHMWRFLPVMPLGYATRLFRLSNSKYDLFRSGTSLAPGIIKGSKNQGIPPPNYSSCFLKAGSGSRHLRRLKILCLLNGNPMTIAGISSEGVSTLHQFSTSPCLKWCLRSPKHCSECNRPYTSERSHRAVCTRKEVSCVYPDTNSGQSVVLRRVDGYFKCIRCGKALKKDQNMKVHLSQIAQHAAKLTFIRPMLVNVTATAR
jgi:hypothetical protein